MLSKDEFIEPLVALRSDQIVVTTMGMVRPWGRLSQSPLDFASADSAMGHAADLAIGLALARPERRVICLNGDGSMLMNPGSLVTAVESGAENLLLFVVQNGTYEITGNQAIPGRRSLDWVRIARGCGFPLAYSFSEAASYRARLPELLQARGPVFAAVQVEPGQEGPLRRGPHVPEPYLRPSLAEAAHAFRHHLLSLSRSG